MVLSKEEILNGINNIEEHEIKALNDTVYLRPLSEAEMIEVEKIEAKGMGIFESTQKGNRDATNRGKINLEKATGSSGQARLTKIMMSINNEKNPDEWNVEEVGQLPRGAIVEMDHIIDEISGVNATKREVENFPEDE